MNRNKRMARLATWAIAGWAGWCVGDAGLSAPCWAQEKPAAVRMASEQFDIWRALIELELLSDPATFPYSFKVHATADGIELRGYVPSELIRERALALARKVCPLPLTDALVVQRNMSLPLPSKLPKDLPAQVRHRLEQTCPGLAAEVQVNDSGVVRLTGNVPSLEEKLLCSRALRQVPGVSAVRNELEVAGRGIGQAGPGSLSGHDLQEVRPLSRQVVEKAQPMAAPAPAPATSTGRWTILPPPPVPPAPGTLRSEVAERLGQRTSPPASSASEVKQAGTSGKTSEPGSAPASSSLPASPVPDSAAPAPGPAASKPSPIAPGVPEPQVQAVIKSKVRSQLGPDCRSVDLHFDGRGGVILKVHLQQHADIHQAITQILQVPELAGYEVQMDFKLVP
jgi:osmotically-inducible protein OsmY